MRTRPERTLPRFLSAARQVGQSRPEMAAELLRLEYQRERLTSEITTLAKRQALAADSYTAVLARMTWLHGMLGLEARKGAPPEGLQITPAQADALKSLAEQARAAGSAARHAYPRVASQSPASRRVAK